MDDEEICNECGLSVAAGKGLFVNRVPDGNSQGERKEMGKAYPKGGWMCRECEYKAQVEFEEGEFRNKTRGGAHGTGTD